MNIAFIGLAKTVISAVLNPAVLGVTDWKTDRHILSAAGPSEKPKKNSIRAGTMIRTAEAAGYDRKE